MADFEQLCDGGVKTQRQVQFRCPKQNHVGDGKDFAMTTPTIYKKIGFTYTKGDKNPETGAISPFYY